MRLAVLGAGMVGRAMVYDLCRQDDVDEVLVADRDAGKAREVAERYGAGKARGRALDVTDREAVGGFIEGSRAALGAVSYRFNQALAEIAIAAGVHWIDLGGNNDVVEAQFALSDRARAAGVAVVPDCGIAPGAVGILAARLLELAPAADSIRLRVGGLPLRPVPPFNYQVVFSVEGLINEYREPAVCLRGGAVVERPSLDDLESVEFPPPFGVLEAFNTSGGASTLPRTFRGRVENLDYKTLRYPGHCELIRALFALGLAGEEPVAVDGVRVAPRRLLERQIAASLSFEGPDAILALAEASGREGVVRLRIIDRHDEATGLSAMARCTAFPATVIAHMLAGGAVEERGTLHQETSIPPALFIDELRRRSIEVVEERS